MSSSDIFHSLVKSIEENQFSTFSRQFSKISPKSFECGLWAPVLYCKAKLGKKESFIMYIENYCKEYGIKLK